MSSDFQEFLDILRGKAIFLKHNIKGKNNKILSIYNGKKREITSKNIKTKFYIEGDNNIIIFNSERKLSKHFPKGLDIKIKGNNNYIEITEPRFENSKILMRRDNSVFKMGKTINCVEGAFFNIDAGASLIIEDECELGNGSLQITANGDYDTKHKILIKKGTHIAFNSIIRNSDGECLIDKDTDMPRNEPQDVIIGEDCWITSRCTILKGVELPKGTVVGANSLVLDKFKDEHTLVAGSPAVVKKHNVYWTIGNYGKNMEKYLESRNLENLEK